MPDWQTERVPVPREFLGQARVFYQAVQRETQAFSAEANSLCDGFRPTLAKGGRLRSEQFKHAAIAWRRLSAELGGFRLTLPHVSKSVHGLTLSEVRLATADVCFDHWGDKTSRELSVTVNRFRLALTHAKFELSILSPVVVSLHALARRYQRNRDCADQDIKDDLQALLSRQDAGGGARYFSVRCQGGLWVGEVVRATLRGGESMPVACVRSFLPPRQSLARPGLPAPSASLAAWQEPAGAAGRLTAFEGSPGRTS